MMKILKLEDFDSPTFDNLATIGLVGDVLRYSSYDGKQDESHPLFKYLRNYPVITADMLAMRESARTTSEGDLFLPVQDSIFKKIANVWREKGFVEAVRLAASTDSERITKIVHWIATRLKWTLDLLEKGIYQKDVLPAIGFGSVVDIVTTRGWDASLVRCLAWHPHCTRIAVATRDDRIRIVSQGVTGIPILRHGAQISICCLSWRPYSGRELAVACSKGVLVWTVELGTAGNSLSQAVLLKQRNHVPVTSVAWHPQMDVLVSCSPMDLNMIIWDVSKEEGVPLKRIGGGGLCFTTWSSCGSRLFAATCRNIFRVWNTGVPTPWKADKWTVPSGRVAAACFGPNLSLLFASTDQPTIFSLPLQKNIFDNKKTVEDDVKIAVPLINLEEINFASGDNENYVTVGGRIVAMEWDSSGKYLAVLFQNSPVIALIKTKINSLSKVVEASPGCLIKGFPGEVPNCIDFHKNREFTNVIICLTIAWSSGRVQHFPIIENEATVDITRSTTLSNTFSRRSELYSNFDLNNYNLF